MSNTASTLSDLATQQFGSRVAAHNDRVVRAAEAIDADSSPENVEAVVRRETSGLGLYVPQSFVDSVVHAVSTPAEEEAAEETVAYLTDAQVEAIVESATSKYGHVIDREGVINVLDEAGLIEPQPEPEPEPESETSLVQRLVEFAKRYGFKG